MNSINKKEFENTSDGSSYYSSESQENILDIKYFFNAIKRRKKIVILASLLIFTFALARIIYKRNFEPTYKGRFTLLISDPLTKSNGQVSSDGPIYSQIARNMGKTDIPTLIEVLRSPLVLEPVAKNNNLSYKNLVSRISIKTGGTGTRDREAKGILHIDFVTGSLNKGNKVIKDLSKEYLQTAVIIKQQKLNEGLKFLENQKLNLEKDKEILEINLAKFREENKLLEPIIEGEEIKKFEFIITRNLLELESRLSKLLLVKEQILDGKLTTTGYAEFINDGGISYSSAFSQPKETGLKINSSDISYLNNIIDLEEKLANASSKYKANSPIVQGLEARLKILKPILRDKQIETINTSIFLIETKIKDLKDQKLKVEKVFREKPGLIGKYNSLVTNLEIATLNLKNLLKAREEFSLEIAQRSVPWRLLDEPKISPVVISPIYSRDIPAAFTLALIIGFLIGYLRDRIDYVYYEPDDIRDEINAPLLGVIPYQESLINVREEKASLLEQLEKLDSAQANNDYAYYAQFQLQEEFRNIYKSFRFLNSSNNLRSICISSTIPAEGKSIITILLAKTLNDLGKKILLVDADMRKPTLHTRLNVNNVKGLSNYLVDEKLNWQDVLIPLSSKKGWDIITAGMVPPDSVRLLSSNKFSDLNKQIIESNNYDLIIYDTPPLLGLADAQLVADSTQGLILVSTVGKVKRNLLKKSIKQIEQNNTTLLGSICNIVSKQTIKTASNGYYSYNYLGDYYNKSNEKERKETINDIENLNYLTKLKTILLNFFKWIDS